MLRPEVKPQSSGVFVSSSVWNLLLRRFLFNRAIFLQLLLLFLLETHGTLSCHIQYNTRQSETHLSRHCINCITLKPRSSNLEIVESPTDAENIIFFKSW